MKGQVLLLVVLIKLFAASIMTGQEGLIAVEVRVTAASGNDVYIDAGRLAGLKAGDHVEFNVATKTVRAVLQSVSMTSSRARIEGEDSVAVGEAGVIRIPGDRLSTAASPSQQDGPSSTIEWEAPTIPWETDTPLLAPVAARPPSTRPTKVSGRLFTLIDQTWDDEHDQRFLLLRQGLDATMTNPLDSGGKLRLDVEGFRRETHLDDFSETDDRVRLDRLSYSWGGTRERSTRAEIGRFLQFEFPELGVLDGLEVAQRTDSDSRYGLSVGYFPDPRSDFKTGDDLQAAVFYRGPRSSPRLGPRIDWGLAWQNTWHRGEKDRNLIVTDIDYRPNKSLSLSGASQIDHYGHGDTIKSSGFELTELDLRSRYNLESEAGIGAYFSHRRWPEILREEFASLTPDQIRSNRLQRVGVDAWRTLLRGFRVSVRADTWKDQDDSGSSESARVSARDWLYKRGQISLDLFGSQGAFSKTDGIRLSADRQISASFSGIQYERVRSRQDDFTGKQSKLITHRVRVHWDISIADWSISSYVESRFGDSQDSFVAGIFLQYRF